MSEIVTVFKKNETNKRMLKVFSGKRILFLENDYGLHNSVGNFYRWCIENKMKTNALFNLTQLKPEYILEQIEWFDVIVFETQWVYEISKILKEKVSAMSEKKIILECYIYEPTWYIKPKVKHDVYTLDSADENMDEWNFKKLKSKQ